ncbi:SusC/RagA family TonB-linked outer membrane protein [Flagellimonas sp. HMM57]|uniref:SusC/RagA family TonB-linked outer membrane protein n=1 Tax=unclassified Flagellimonas TaxID=2644544 RepID=UPI0013D11114|nr:MULTISPECIES: SusC/RagA family TonB-linked outer membrane protein [unclassified Flagellimonas]UII75308.1 SusC/RagA family TonB-linked outer membrane protein [Flagellimonas sp. HMM57]
MKKTNLNLGRLLLFLPLLILFCSSTIYGQDNQYVVTGTVTDAANGSPIPGASVFIENTSFGSVTDFDGNYSFEATLSSGSYTLVASYLGFSSSKSEVTFGSNSAVSTDFTLKEDLLSLDEVVVTGSTVVQERKKLGNAVTTVKSVELLKADPINVTSAIQGKVPGAQITQNSGDPAGGFSIRLRGPSTISGSSEPLYIVDGVIASNLTTNVTNINVSAGDASPGQNRMVDINPNDIQDINILNGSAAAAIYGSRASNGVVVITTKRGSNMADGPEIFFKTSFNVNQLRKEVDVNLRGEQFGGEDVRLWPIFGRDAEGNTTPFANLLTNKVDVQRFDYQDLIFQTGLGTDNYLSVRDGNEKMGYAASVGYLSNEGIIKNTKYNRLSARLNFNHTVNDWLSYNVGLYFMNSTSDEKPDGNVFWSPINSVNITNNIYDATQRDANGNLQSVEPTRVNPLSIIEEFDITQDVTRFIPNLTVSLRPTDFLTIDQIFGMDTYKQEGNISIPIYPYEPVNAAYFNQGFQGNAEATVFNWNYDVNATFDFDINENINSQTIVGYNFQSSSVEDSGTQGRDLDANGVPTVPLQPQEGDDRLDIFGAFIQETLSFSDRYFLTFAGRIDGATNFDPDKRTNFYPKVSGSYVLSSEPFWENSGISNVINSARIRTSYGEAGNLTAVGPYARFGRYNPNEFQGTTTLNQSSALGNEGLEVERLKEFEIGTDLSLFDNRASILFTYYNQEISDLIVQRTLAPSEGGLTRFDNVGSMKNNGLEIYLRVTPIKTDNLKWDLNFNFSRNRNEVTATTGGPISIATVSGAPPQVREGEPLGVFYGTYFARNDDGSLLLTEDGLPQQERGDALAGTIQRDGDGQPTGDPLRRVIGDPNPDYLLGIGTDLQYKQFSFSMLWESVQGFDVFDADKRTRQGVGVGRLAEQELSGELPRGYISSIYPIQEFRMEDGSFVKLREVSLGYTFPELFKGVKNFTVALKGRNLISIDNFFSYDPETNAGGQSNLLRAVNFGNVPIPRTFILSLSANF